MVSVLSKSRRPLPAVKAKCFTHGSILQSPGAVKVFFLTGYSCIFFLPDGETFVKNHPKGRWIMDMGQTQHIPDAALADYGETLARQLQLEGTVSARRLSRE